MQSFIKRAKPSSTALSHWPRSAGYTIHSYIRIMLERDKKCLALTEKRTWRACVRSETSTTQIMFSQSSRLGISTCKDYLYIGPYIQESFFEDLLSFSPFFSSSTSRLRFLMASGGLSSMRSLLFCISLHLGRPSGISSRRLE
jgi:hypothetical protein